MTTRQICKHDRGSQRLNYKAARYGYTDLVCYAAVPQGHSGNLTSLPPSLP
ncbi:hypothetical protein DPMN_064662 [Dreissena polymorpha]|uniref:Uncharacterized protein n=1 Tax=Dreissena polymorpha TaxID=45954 RepID=A0A9D4HL86_DREPO|nr:hypothetical protein DPMN_064662 [Dreissena polymorpha]